MQRSFMKALSVRIKSADNRVILEVQPTLTKLLQSLAGVEEVLAQGQPLPDCDYFAPC